MAKKEPGVTRREILKKAVFVAPVVLSLPAGAAYARNGSGRHERRPRQRSWGRRDD